MKSDLANIHSVWELFERAARDNEQREAVVDPFNRSSLCASEPKRWRYGELREHALGIAARLHSQGVGAGDRVLVQLPNIVELMAVYLAVARLGAVISPVPMQYRRHELTTILDQSEPRAVICIDRFKDTEPLVELYPLLPDNTPCLVVGKISHPQQLSLMASTNSELLGDDAQLPTQENLYTLCWTSGTTGTPKAVPRRHRHWLAMIPVFEDATELAEHATMLAPFPMINMAAISTFLLYWLSVKGRLILHHPLDLPVFLKQIEQEKAEYTVAPPALLTLLLAKPELMDSVDMTSLRVIGSGSAPLSPSMIRGFKDRLNVDIVNMFGSNEGCCLVADAADVPNPDDRATRFPRFGYPEFCWRNRMAATLLTKLVNTESGQVINSRGQPGELRIKGPTVFEGYWQSEADNKLVFDAEGYFRTGDLFEITGTENEFYRFVGRCKDIIVRGGMKISPEEIDQLLVGHPELQEAAVVGIADAILGQKICAAVVARPDTKPTLESVCKYLSERGIAKFKLPERLELCEALPRNPLGKVVRSQLEELIQ
ncbi:MAG: acyl-CoA synthetase (AMP-forming)/AMP-acid ligase II [Bermanella sp.]|jgi:acyl-CoA synthetase (AMP-forming)/AMP-acid ligase II